jgi:peptidase inhibitor family I36
MSTNRKVRKAPILASLALIVAAGFAPVTAVQAGGAGVQSCSQAWVNIWEHYGFNGRGLHICYGVSIPNLATYGFNNITSSAQFDEITVNTTVCLYSEINYIGEIWKATSDASVQWIFPPNDWASSVKFGC